jgi:hypothetical protein
MARMVTSTAVKKIITKGLTGWEAGKLLLQNLVDTHCNKPPLLSEADIFAIENMSMQSQDAKDYNILMGLGRRLEKGLMICHMACNEACLDISFLVTLIRDACNHKTSELLSSFLPRIVTRKQYDDIVSAQKQKKLEFEYSLGYAMEERFYFLAPRGARNEIDELCVDIESAESFVSVVPDKYSAFCEQAIREIHTLYIDGKLKAVYQKEDEEQVKPLLGKWSNNELSMKETLKLVDMLFVTGQHLYECEELPEWKKYMDEYQIYLFGDDDKRFWHNYAILEDCPESWLDDNGYYENPLPPGKWMTRRIEIALGLQATEGKKVKSIRLVSSELQAVLNRVALNTRIFLALRVILEVAINRVGLYISEKEWTLSDLNEKLELYAEEYNHKLSEVKEKSKWWNSGENKLEKVLKTLSLIDISKFEPLTESVEKLKNNILDGVRDSMWLREKSLSLEYDDGFDFRQFMKDR